MEIESLTLIVEEADLQQMVSRHVQASAPVKDLTVKLLPEGAIVRGSYPTFLVSIPFESHWKLSVKSHRLRAQLTRISIVGLSADAVRSAILGNLQALTAKEAGTQVEGDRMIIDLDRVLHAQGLSIKTNLQSVQLEVGRMILRASA